jgi:hypothetical protein
MNSISFDRLVILEELIFIKLMKKSPPAVDSNVHHCIHKILLLDHILIYKAVHLTSSQIISVISIPILSFSLRRSLSKLIHFFSVAINHKVHIYIPNRRR